MTNTTFLSGRTAIITGAGQGLGREHALEFGRLGANVVVNDWSDAANDVAEEIRAAGGQAVATTGDVADWAYGEQLVATAVENFGGLDALVNNAGINRDRMLANMSEEEWDAVMRVSLKGHFVPMRHACAYWRDEAKAGRNRLARIVNTSSGAGLLGSVGQGNYAAAKAGILALTQVAAAEWGRYGILVNAIAPSARTPMTTAVPAMAERMAAPESGFDAMHPGNVSPLVAFLASAENEVTGRVFEIEADEVSVADGWHHGEVAKAGGRRWEAAELGPVLDKLIAEAPQPTPVYGAQ